MIFFSQRIFFLPTKGSLGTALQSLSQVFVVGAFVDIIFAALKIEPLEQIATEEDWEKMEGFLRLIGRKSLLAW